MKLMQYLRRTTDQGIVCGWTSRNGTKLSARVDADHVTYQNTQRSDLGPALTLAGDAINWFSWEQKISASAKSEYIALALAEATKELRPRRTGK